MLRGLKRTAGVLCVVMPAALSGCADTIYPQLPVIGGGGAGNLLTQSEQEKTIKDLTSEQKSHGADAAKAIEKSGN